VYYSLVISVKDIRRIFELKPHWDFLPYPSQPVADLGKSGMRYYLKEQVHKWFLDSNIPYTLRIKITAENIQVFIIFNNKENAMLFKLSWTGI
jgi:hypothetical protein